MKALLVGALWLALPHARAAVLSHTRSETRSGTLALGSLEVPLFESAVGRLDSVTIQIDPISQVYATANGMNTGETADVATVQFQATMRVSNGRERISDFVSESTSLLISPGSQSTSSLIGRVTGANQLVTDPMALLAWTGTGTQQLLWELVDFNASFQATTSTGGVTLEAVVLSITVFYTYTLPVSPNPLRYDPTDGTFHYVEGDLPVVIEHRSKLVDVQPWNMRYETGTNTVGNVVKFPLEGEVGFYRVRFADPPLSRSPQWETGKEQFAGHANSQTDPRP